MVCDRKRENIQEERKAADHGGNDEKGERGGGCEGRSVGYSDI